MLDVLSGNILTVTTREIWWMAGAGAVAIALHTLLAKQFAVLDVRPGNGAGGGHPLRHGGICFSS